MMSLKKYALYISLIFTIFPFNYSKAENNKIPIEIKLIASNFTIPWGMALLPTNTMLITQREGTLSKLDLVTSKVSTISGLPTNIKVKGQGGLLDVALSPNYNSTGWIYFSYSKNILGNGATTLSRAKLSHNHLQKWQDLITTQSITSTNVHYGGRITFDHNGHVFLSVGDRGIRQNAQNLGNHAGTILRLNLDGSVPIDNPYISNPNALNEIWSYGHRNPQGLFFNIQNHALWSIEHGPRGGDEINLIEGGHNYGWPIISYGKEYHQDVPVGQGTHLEGMQQPIKTYSPSIAPSGLIQYSGKAFKNWQGNLLTGSMKLRHLNRVVLNKKNIAIDEVRLLRGVNGRIRNIIEDSNGWIYIASDDGRILRLKPKD